MKSNKLISLFVVCLVLITSWQWYESRQRELELRVEVAQLLDQINVLESRLAATETAVEKLQEESLPSIVKKANSTLLDAWQGLLNGLQQKVEESRRELDEDAAEPQKGELELKRT